MGGLANGFVNLFKNWGRGIGNAADNFLLGADARKAISDEVINKFQPMIERIDRAKNKRAANITELNKKLAQSKQDLRDAKNAWQDKYNTALADAKAQRQTDITNYDAELKRYQDAVDNAKQGRQDILDKLKDSEASYDDLKTIFTDVNTGTRYIFDPSIGKYEELSKFYNKLTPKDKQKFNSDIRNYETRLYDSNTNRVINAFDKSSKQYKGYSIFDNYLGRVRASQGTALRDADTQITQANDALTKWKTNNSQPSAWDDNVDLVGFKKNFKANNAKPTEYSFNGQTYTKEADLDKAYQYALTNANNRLSHANKKAVEYASQRDAEIAKRIQDAKDIKKAKLALGAGAGIGALYAGAKAMYGGDDTDTTDNIDNTDNTYTGEPDPDLKLENTPEGKTAYTGKSLIDTDFDPDKAEAEAVLAGAAYDKGVEDGNAVRSSADLGNNIGASTRGHTMDDRLYELIKTMKDRYKADAIANYIYSRHGDDPEVQNLGWRGWLNKYYGDSLRSIMNIDPSGYKGMHISGGL